MIEVANVFGIRLFGRKEARELSADTKDAGDAAATVDHRAASSYLPGRFLPIAEPVVQEGVAKVFAQSLPGLLSRVSVAKLCGLAMLFASK